MHHRLSMRSLLSLAACALLWSCGSDPAPATDVPATVIDTMAATPIVPDWPGYYEGAFPVGKDQRMIVQLWVRSDSTFVIRERRGKADTLPEGSIGNWHVVNVPGGPANGLLRFQYGGDPPDHYQRTEKGLVFVDVIGGVDVAEDWTLEKLADEINEEIPRMRLKGTFTYMADAKSFQPCGSRYTWPCAGGMDWGPEEGELEGSMNGAELEKAYGKAVKQGGDPWTVDVECSLGMGPAMEGDGADEYLFIHKVLNASANCP
jgi:hypothetical protein